MGIYIVKGEFLERSGADAVELLHTLSPSQGVFWLKHLTH